jgi:hypothetical protein
MYFRVVTAKPKLPIPAVIFVSKATYIYGPRRSLPITLAMMIEVNTDPPTPINSSSPYQREFRAIV